ncbi:hypothetical protein BDM02DRAFT_3132675 [Thelephora ganbajun]|uniref:Uncharacterized protein n=1 Tax=Thelephora ganbajun TaxID=370292 RepID=A0ACB6Z0Z9_THEGA|nr:hypothetical protein BDM02DRAFT_3132675 [Thelephora ganbajun]
MSRRSHILESFATVMQKQETSIRSTPATPRRIEPFSGPSHPAFDRLEEMAAKQLKQDFDTLKKGFVRLREKYTQSTAMVSALRAELSTCRGESEQLRGQVATLQEELRVQTEMIPNRVASATSALRTILSELTEKIKCTVCLEIYCNPYRHVFCGLCVAGWFATQHNNTCPECRAMCEGCPQCDFALRDVLQMVYSGLGQEVPTYGSFDATLFDRIYAMMQEFRGLFLTDSQEEDFWAPMVVEVQRMRGIPEDTPGNSVDNAIDIDVDVDMEGETDDSDWELGSGVGSEEGKGETGHAQGEGGADSMQGEHETVDISKLRTVTQWGHGKDFKN